MVIKKQLYDKQGNEVMPITSAECLNDLQIGTVNLIDNNGIINLGGDNNSYKRIPVGDVKVGDVFTFRADSITGNGSGRYFSSINNSKATAASNLIYYNEGTTVKYVIKEDATGAYLCIWNTAQGGAHPEVEVKFSGCTLVKGKVIPSTYFPSLKDAKQALFDDMWLSAVGSYGSIDREGHPDAPYILEGIKHTYEEAIYTLKFGITGYEYPNAGFCDYTGKVMILHWSNGGGSGAGSHTLSACPNLEIIRIVSHLKLNSPEWSFYNLPKLRRVEGRRIQWGNIAYNSQTNYRAFYKSTQLEHILIEKVAANISFENCPLLDLESFQFLVANRNNENNFTVLVHPDVYAKLTDQENTEWYQLNQDAIAKNITFATA